MSESSDLEQRAIRAIQDHEHELAAQAAGTLNLSAITRDACERAGLDPNYVYRLEIGVNRATFHLYRGRNGRCRGPKYCDPVSGEPLRETLEFDAITR